MWPQALLSNWVSYLLTFRQTWWCSGATPSSARDWTQAFCIQSICSVHWAISLALVMSSTDSELGLGTCKVCILTFYSTSPDCLFMVFKIEATTGSARVHQDFMGVGSEGHLVPDLELSALHTLAMCSATWTSLQPQVSQARFRSMRLISLC